MFEKFVISGLVVFVVVTLLVFAEATQRVADNKIQKGLTSEETARQGYQAKQDECSKVLANTLETDAGKKALHRVVNTVIGRNSWKKAMPPGDFAGRDYCYAVQVLNADQYVLSPFN